MDLSIKKEGADINSNFQPTSKKLEVHKSFVCYYFGSKLIKIQKNALVIFAFFFIKRFFSWLDNNFTRPRRIYSEKIFGNSL